MAKPKRTPSPFAQRDNCVNVSSHTRVPSVRNYAEWKERMEQTHEQEICPGCGYYVIWVPKGA